MSQPKEIENTLICAHWLVKQFEELGCISIANLFQKAIDDSELWLDNIAVYDEQIKLADDYIKSKEAKAIHKILIKYAAINDPQQRNKFLKKMTELMN